MKNYNCVWTERMSVNVKAKSEKEAREKVLNCEYDETSVSAELDSDVEVYKINLK